MRWFRIGALVLALVPGAALAQARKPTVAVVRIDDLAGTGQANTLSTMLESAIAGTGKFRTFERRQMGTLVGEQGRAKAGLVTTNQPGKVGGFEGVDYLIYGSITTVSAKNSADIGATMLGGLLGNRGTTCSNKTATLALDIKITDAASGEIKYSTHINESQKSATACGGEGSIDTAQLMRSAADRVATGLVTTIYPVQVAAVTADGTLILNYGGAALQTDSVMVVYRKGAEIRDPSSGEVIGSDEVKLGLVRVTEVNARTSKASPVTPFASAPTVGSIVRPASSDDLRALARQSKKR